MESTLRLSQLMSHHRRRSVSHALPSPSARPRSKSRGHLCFLGDHEFFLLENQLFRADIDAPVMADGYRPARWECSESQIERRFAYLTKINSIVG